MTNEYTQYFVDCPDTDCLFDGSGLFSSIVVDLVHRRVTYDGIVWNDITTGGF